MPPLEADILSTINNFLEKYDLDDIRLESYTNDTKRIIAEIINGKIDNYTNSENYIILSYIAEYYRQIKKDNSSAEKYYLMTIKHNDSDSDSMDNLASLYKEQLKLDLV